MGKRSIWVPKICDGICVPGLELWLVRLNLRELLLCSGVNRRGRRDQSSILDGTTCAQSWLVTLSKFGQTPKGQVS